MTLYEPTTTVTDLVLGGFSLYLAQRLWRVASAERSRKFWTAALAASGVAALLGALFHGAGPQLAPVVLRGVWKATMLTIGVVSFSLVAAAAAASFATLRSRMVVLIAATIKLLVYTLWVARESAFIVAVIDYGTAMLFVAALQLRDLKRAGLRARLILAGLLVSIAGATVQASGFTIHRHFNHNDLYHVIQLLATYLLYRGGRLLDDAHSG